MLGHQEASPHPFLYPTGEPGKFYVSPKSSFLELDQTAVQIFHQLKTGADTPQISTELNMPEGEVQTVVNTLHELGLLDESLTAEVRQPDVLSVYIELTEACNFSCSGCATAVDINSEAAQHMSSEFLETQLERIFATAVDRGFKRVKLKFAGGEPLLKSIYQKIILAQPQIAQLTEATGIEVDQVVLTNGVFIKQALPELENIPGIRFAVSIWGLPSSNHTIRKAKSKTDTYKSIQQGLWMLEKKQMPFNVQHTITPQNAHQFAAFLESMWDYRSKNYIGVDQSTGQQHIFRPIPVSFSIFRPQNTFQFEQMQRLQGYEKMVDGILKGIAYAESLVQKGIIPLEFLKKFDYVNLKQQKLTTCGTGINYIAIGPNKAAQPCHQLLHTAPQARRESAVDILNEANENQLISIALNQDMQDQDLHTKLLLTLHGGGGCPLVNKLNSAAQEANTFLYSQIIPALLSVIARQSVS